MSEFHSHLITLEEVIEKKYFFNIPIYQRLYVWGKEQIHSLLDDIIAAWQEDKNQFYLGGALVIERPSSSGTLYDLIDGQQRFTTLWLLSIVLGEQLHDYQKVQTDEGVRLRINFAIRPQVTEFFEKLCKNESADLPQAKQLEDALQEIKSYFDNAENVIDKTALTAFIRTKVQLILTKVPENTDLNKLFEVINNRGIQLQHHEILKAKLLESIETQEREPYALLWDACADMNGYVERHLRAITKIDTLPLFENKIDPESKREQLGNAKHVIEALQQIKSDDKTEAMSLESILRQEQNVIAKDNEQENETRNALPERVASIISFSMLLQHVLRIYLQQNAEYKEKDIQKISDKDLLHIFNQNWLKAEPNSEQIKLFFELLWNVRYQFDKHIVKWILIEEKKSHAIRRLYVNRNENKKTAYLQRNSTDADPGFALLQSMLYHSQQMTTQYWLTPLLKFLLECDEKQAELYLQHLDNHLLCSEADAPLLERSRRYLENCWHRESIIPPALSLNKTYSNGTQYPHYWFYKLEYVLYLHLKAQVSKQVENFRITAKNSVEHVTPQHPELKEDTLPDPLLHHFGNLALVTSSMNSEMSNKGFSIKKVEFEHRHKGKGISLKLESIFNNTQWQEAEIIEHQKQMIKIFDTYLHDVEQKVNALGIKT